MFVNVIKSHENKKKSIDPKTTIPCVCQPDILFVCAIELHCCLKTIKTYNQVRALHWVTCSLIIINIDTVYFDPILQTQSCILKCHFLKKKELSICDMF